MAEPQIIEDNYTRTELRAHECIPDPCPCQDLQVQPADDTVGIHAQLYAVEVLGDGAGILESIGDLDAAD